MAAEVEPPELAELLDHAERPRAGGWSLRAALTRYAQPEPQRASDILELVRRAEFGLRPHLKAIERAGDAHWRAVRDGEAADGLEPLAVGILRFLVELDGLAAALAAWAADPSTARPDAEVDAVTARVAAGFDELGVPREERQRPPRGRG